MREKRYINFNWLYNANYKEEHVSNYTNVNDFERVDLPHCAVEIPFNNFDETMLHIECTYKKEITIDETWQGKIIKLGFEGVANIAHVFIDDAFVTTHKGGYTPFVMDITEYVEIGKTHIVTVVVDSHENVFVPPFGGVVDFLGYSGIYREVYLEIINPNYIVDYFIRTYNPTENSLVSIGLDLTADYGTMDICVYDQNKERIHTKVPVNSKHMEIKIDIGEKQLWNLDNPYLYQIVFQLHQDEILCDQIITRFGFREIKFNDDGFYLNKEKIKLCGLNRHQSYPYVGNAMPKNIQIEDADILKYELGINIVRCAHYPQSSHFLNRCDEIGLLVFEEIPGWQHIGGDEWKELSYNNLRDMIVRDRNHPSVVIWGVRINESPDDKDFYSKTNEIARLLDDTRPTGGVRNIAKSQFLEDVYTYNDFSHRGNNKGLAKKSQITRRKNPYLVTEFNGHMFPSKRYDNEPHLLEHAKRHLNVLDAMYEPKNKISGAIGWCMNDYNTHQEFGSGDRVCYHGVLDMFRIPKLASYVYASQQKHNPVLSISSQMNIGDYPAGELNEVFAFTNCDYIKLYKNNEYIKTFYPEKNKYPNMPNPPIIIDDFIGELIEKNEHFSPKDSEICKNILRAIGKYGSQLPLTYKLKVLRLLKKYNLTFDQGVKLFFKYVGGWGTKKVSYRFDGYIDDTKVKTVIKENHDEFRYVIEYNRKVLKVEDTYDALRVVIKKVNQHNEIIPYSFDPISIKTEGSIDIIGPNLIHLQGGVAAFYVKTNQNKGIGTIYIQADHMLVETIMVK